MRLKVSARNPRIKTRQGNFDLAVAVEYTGGFKPSKLLVMGNSTFMSDALYERYGSNTGMYFFVNSLLWMYDQKDDVYIAPKMYQSQTISVTAMQRNVFMILLVVVLPLLVLAWSICISKEASFMSLYKRIIILAAVLLVLRRIYIPLKTGWHRQQQSLLEQL